MSFPFYIQSPTGRIHRAGDRKGLDRFVTRCGYRVGPWSRNRWGKLIETPAFVPPGDQQSRCRRCWPEFVEPDANVSRKPSPEGPGWQIKDTEYAGELVLADVYGSKSDAEGQATVWNKEHRDWLGA